MRASSTSGDATLAVFLDLENIALGAREAGYAEFEIHKVLDRLLLKGHIVVRKAYCDFGRYKDFKRGLHEAAFELIEIPHVRQSGKNSADIRMVVDALDLCYTKGHVDTFVIISGDSDFSPLVSKLRENAKIVIGVGVKKSTSDLFINICDDFIYYDDLVRVQPVRGQTRAAPGAGPDGGAAAAKAGLAAPPTKVSPTAAAGGEQKRPAKPAALSVDRAVKELMETLEALSTERAGDEVLWASMVKQALKRRNPGFNERAHGLNSFQDLLREAEKRKLITLTADTKANSLTVRLAEPAG